MPKLINDSSRKDLRKKLRNNPTRAELLLWYHVKSEQLGVKFRRQVSIGMFIVDFYVPSKKVIVELDGDSHFRNEEKQRYDLHRDEFLRSQGFRVLHFTDNEIQESLENVMEIMRKAVTPPLTPPQRGGEEFLIDAGHVS